MTEKIVKLNIGGQNNITIGKDLLNSVKYSKLFNHIKSEYKKVVGNGVIFLDRDPEAFRLMLIYLRNRRQSMPKLTDKFQQQIFEDEINFWGLNLQKYHE